MLILPLDHLPVGDKELVLSLISDLGQEHLFSHCTTAAELDRMLVQVKQANLTLAPGGLKEYIERGRKLLLESKEGVNPFDGCEVSVPKGVVLDPSSREYETFETLGEGEISKLCFVLVAGGLGERLGFPGIKISLPVETQTGICYMEFFAQSILEFQNVARGKTENPTLELPLAIMTSADTHQPTLDLLQSNHYFGLSPNQVTLMMQGKVPCFDNSEGRLAVSPSTHAMEMKPHGHGDVHGLLLQTGLAEKWFHEEKRKWVFFFQDTNSLSFRSLCACLGVSKRENFAMNSLSVPRAPGEASGAICGLKLKDGRNLTASVEYNMLGPLLQAQGGDIALQDGSGVSAYPGNCNILLFDLEQYVPALLESKGVVPEFVNPKYSDSTKTAFKAPTRLECLMQDFALLLHNVPVGFCAMPRWLTFSVVKNSAADAALKRPMDCALSGECEFFDSNCKLLTIATSKAGYKSFGLADASSAVSFNNLTHAMGPRISLLPSFGISLKSISSKIKGDVILDNGNKTSLVIQGRDTVLNHIHVSGALVIDNCHANHVRVDNDGWTLEQAPPDSPPEIAIRGFIVNKLATAHIK